jgi:hypothetical protein
VSTWRRHLGSSEIGEFIDLMYALNATVISATVFVVGLSDLSWRAQRLLRCKGFELDQPAKGANLEVQAH